jgi:hypothetical protein
VREGNESGKLQIRDKRVQSTSPTKIEHKRRAGINLTKVRRAGVRGGVKATGPIRPRSTHTYTTSFAVAWLRDNTE